MIKAIVEKCLLLLWRHIEFYLAYFETSTDGYQLYKSDFGSGEYRMDEYQNFKMANDQTMRLRNNIASNKIGEKKNKDAKV